MFGDFKVQIRDNIGKSDKRIFLFQTNQKATIFVTHKGTVEIFQEGSNIDENEVYFADMSDDMLYAFANTLADRGIKTNKDSIAEGKLIATEKHLEDMRTIALKRYK